MGKTEESLTRRHLLQIAGVGSAAVLAAPHVAFAETQEGPPRRDPQGEKHGRAAGPSLSLYFLARTLIGCTEAAGKRRVGFDRKPADTITSFKLSEDEWRVFVEMASDGDVIRNTAAQELRDAQLDEAVVKAFVDDFNEFVACWKGICDGYDYDEKWECKLEQGGMACPTPTPGTDPHVRVPGTERYQGPRPHVDEGGVKPVGDGSRDYWVHGEGFLPYAVVELRKADSDPADPQGLEGTYEAKPQPSTFRCSRLKFTPDADKKGPFDVYVVNMYAPKAVKVFRFGKGKVVL